MLLRTDREARTVVGALAAVLGASALLACGGPLGPLNLVAEDGVLDVATPRPRGDRLRIVRRFAWTAPSPWAGIALLMDDDDWASYWRSEPGAGPPSGTPLAIDFDRFAAVVAHGYAPHARGDEIEIAEVVTTGDTVHVFAVQTLAAGDCPEAPPRGLVRVAVVERPRVPRGFTLHVVTDRVSGAPCSPEGQPVQVTRHPAAGNRIPVVDD